MFAPHKHGKIQMNSLAFSALAFPDFDPVIFQIGPFAPRWYGLGYVVGILFAWWYGKKLLKKSSLWKNDTAPMAPNLLDDFVIWSAVAVVVGGRLGEVLIYRRAEYFADPIRILKITEGGMSFHGGFIAMVLAMFLFAYVKKVSLLSMFDTIAAGAPIGLGIVRICNFINGELWGRPTDVPWAFIFPNAPLVDGVNVPRHPSQLYEAGLEGFLPFIVLAILIFRFKALKKPGAIAGTFAAGYGLARTFVEFYRAPSTDFVAGGWLTTGMAWSLPMVAVGGALIIWSIWANRQTA